MSEIRRHAQRAVTGCCVAFTVFFVGCSVDPEHHVRSGADPRYEDNDVAFRTTYYFRVFDYCGHKQKERYVAGAIPSTNGLYRFKMTGKANTSTNQIKFESGTLKSWEVDPLGASVVYDKDIGRHRFVSEDETQSEAKQKRAWAEYQQLQDEYKRLSEQVGQKTQTKNQLTTEILAAVSDAAAIDNTTLTDGLTRVFGENTDRLTVLNTTLKNSITDAITEKQKEILDNNKALMTEKLISAGNMWLLAQIKESIKTRTHSAVNQENLPDELLQNGEAQKKWNELITKITSVIKEIAENQQSLMSAYSLLDDISDIASAKVTVAASQTRAVQPLAEKYIQQLNNFQLAPLQSQFQAIFTELKNKLKKAEAPEQFENMTDEHRDWVRSKIVSLTEQLFASENLLKTQLNFPDLDINFEADHANILAEINRQNITKELSSATAPLIDTAVENTHYLASGEMNSTLETLKAAMNTKLRIATGTAAASNASGDIEPLTKGTDTAINCDNINEQKGFQILGPEGWRTFNPDERLIMAMYVDNAPITQVLKQLSQQVLNAHKSNEPNLVPVVQAELRLSQARQQLFEQKTALAAAVTDQKALALCELVNQVNQKLHVSETAAASSVQDCKGK